ncbi:MAG: TonB family protein [Treponema sp.]|jgi:TonB family protein|nr:TonB family protein [Treponema sp.]
MKKNKVFWSMLGLSAAIHGLVMIGVSGSGFHTPSSALEDKLVSTLKIIQVATTPQREAPSTPIEKKTIEKPVEIPPKIVPVQDTTPVEEVLEDHETREGESENSEAQEGCNNTGNNEAAPENGAGNGGTVTDREYEALLAYIKEFVDKNLVYPPMARRRNVEGVVGVYFEIEGNGSLAAITVDHSSGSSILDNAAVSLVKKMHPPENLTLNRTLALRINIAYELTE